MAKEHPDDHRHASGDAANGSVNRNLSAHILPTSATMVGVCMTVLAIRHLTPLTEVQLVVDKLLAIDALLFLASGIFSFVSIQGRGASESFERSAEQVFLIAQGLLAIGAVVLAFVVT